jgi:hypothetical protein
MKGVSEPAGTVLVPLAGLVSMTVPSTEERAELVAAWSCKSTFANAARWAI